jgi:hypothetical protein
MSVAAKDRLVKTFNFDFVSEVDDVRYQGNFTIKKMNIRDLAAVGVRKAQLNGGMYFDGENPGRGVDEETDSFNNMIAHLEIAIKSGPPWWDLNKITDMRLVGKVFQEVIEFENSFLRRAAERAVADGLSAGGGAAAVSEANVAAGVRAVVGSEVSAALEP